TLSRTAAPALALNGTAPSAMAPAPTAPVPDLTAQVWHLTPDVARELLRTAHANRPLVKAQVRQLIEDIRGGRWRLNGESLVLDADLRLLDGRHRCMAVAESGITVDALVAVGVDPQVMDSIDQGKSRSGAALLHVHQLPHADDLAPAARWLWRYEQGV